MATEEVKGNQQFVRRSSPNHLESYENRCQYNCVRAIHADRLNGGEAFSWLAAFAGERHIMPNISGCTTGLQSTDDVALCQMLVFQAHG